MNDCQREHMSPASGKKYIFRTNHDGAHTLDTPLPVHMFLLPIATDARITLCTPLSSTHSSATNHDGRTKKAHFGHPYTCTAPAYKVKYVPAAEHTLTTLHVYSSLIPEISISTYVRHWSRVFRVGVQPQITRPPPRRPQMKDGRHRDRNISYVQPWSLLGFRLF